MDDDVYNNIVFYYINYSIVQFRAGVYNIHNIKTLNEYFIFI